MMNLKTHTAYPETQVDPVTGNWTCRLYARNGEVKETFKGTVSTEGRTSKEIRSAATQAALQKVNIVKTKYEV